MKLTNMFLDKLASYIEANYVEEEISKPKKKSIFSGFKVKECASREIDDVCESSISVPDEICDEECSDSAASFFGSGVPMAAAMQSMPTGAAPRKLEDVIANLDKSFMELVFSFADDKGLSDVDLQKKGNIDRKAFSKLRCGTTKKPSKSTAMALAIALELNLDETKDLLSRAGYALSPCSKQDLIVQFFIENEAYDIYELNEVLTQYGEPELGVRL